MKKIFLSLVIVALSFVTYGQAKVELGLKAGANFANTDIDNAESITAFHGGAYGLMKIANIGVQPEILWSKQGNDLSGLGELDLNYVNIPVMLKLYMPLGLNLQAGPQFGILLSSDATAPDGTDFSDTLSDSDLSAALGAGWDAPFGLQFNARYVLGLSDINDGQGESIKNRTFQLSIGYRLFKLGK